ncbi:hypothetical protein H696_05357 [Fonticula alba]|uniref:Uncharacterized protein n=1 Tax=Fonticula alba TaxID=691883 RepID=A0A058Z1F5_FONAL|nr:hypothetical protein H696_05357 [Fonticula alba]KCV68104.1 hypothetical protein H696_05357 [Fonticula alba]|eukprot:XP_009497478.1 hypothetical protein H696_05357 [Fonticula alba]
MSLPSAAPRPEAASPELQREFEQLAHAEPTLLDDIRAHPVSIEATASDLALVRDLMKRSKFEFVEVGAKRYFLEYLSEGMTADINVDILKLDVENDKMAVRQLKQERLQAASDLGLLFNELLAARSELSTELEDLAADLARLQSLEEEAARLEGLQAE